MKIPINKIKTPMHAANMGTTIPWTDDDPFHWRIRHISPHLIEFKTTYTQIITHRLSHNFIQI